MLSSYIYVSFVGGMKTAKYPFLAVAGWAQDGVVRDLNKLSGVTASIESTGNGTSGTLIVDTESEEQMQVATLFISQSAIYRPLFKSSQ